MNCTHCQAQTPEGITLCHNCTTQLEQILNTLPDLLLEAETTMARMDRIGQSHGGNTRTREGINLEALDRVREVQALLTSWAQMIFDTCDAQGTRIRNGLSSVEILKEHMPIIRTHDWAADCLNELNKAHHRLCACIDTPPNNRTYGTCLEPECNGTIRGHVGHKTARCKECGFTYPAAQLLAMRLADAHEHPAPLATIIRALDAADTPIKLKTAKTWVERGKLKPVAHDERGVNLYTLEQLDTLRREGLKTT